MEPRYDQEYQLIDMKSMDVKKMNSPVEMEKIADIMVANVDNFLVRAYQSLREENRYDRSAMFSATYINGVAINQFLDDMYEENFLNKSQRARMGSLLIARAMLDGDDVTIYPAKSKNPEPVRVNSAFQDLTLNELSGWERFWSHFGFYKDKQREIERKYHTVISLKRELSHLVQDTQRITPDKQKAIVDENIAYAAEQAKLRTDFYDRKQSQEKEVDALYFGDVDSSYFEDSIRSGNKLPERDNFSTRAIFTITTCAMLNKGHTLENICDPTYTIDRKEVGQYVAELSHRIASNDPAVADKASQELADIYMQGAQKYLAEPMPPKEELKDFLHSKQPLYLSTLALMGADIGQEFDRGSNATRILSDPSNLVLMDWIGIPSVSGRLGAINAVVQKKENTLEHSDQNNSMVNKNVRNEIIRNTVEKTLRCAYFEEGTDYSGSTIGDYALKNENKKTLGTAFSVISTTLAGSVFCGESNMPLKLEDFVTGKKSIHEMMNKSAVFRREHEDIHESYSKTVGNGLIPERFEKMDLAKKMLDRMTQKMPELPKVVKGKLEKDLYYNKVFQKLTADLPVEEIKKLGEKPAFFTNLVTEAAPKLPVKDKEPVAVAPESVVEAEPVKKDVGLGGM